LFQNRLFIKCFTFLEKVTVQSNLSHATMWFDINKNIIKFGSETIWCSCLCSQSGCLQVLEQNKNSLKQNKYDKYSYLVLPILYSHFRNNCVAIKYSWKSFTALKNRVFLHLSHFHSNIFLRLRRLLDHQILNQPWLV
jgi:ubiquinone/menaquinone biosynthesis C-methylase UbiE